MSEIYLNVKDGLRLWRGEERAGNKRAGFARLKNIHIFASLFKRRATKWMNINNVKIQTIIEAKFTEAIKKLTDNADSKATCDLFIQAYAETGELHIYDEYETLLDKIIIFEWVNSEESAFDEKVSAAMKPALAKLSSLFENPRFRKPFSISIVDDDFNVLEELLFIDDDTVRIDDPLLQNLDSELDSFLAGLLSDMPK
jgi:hypothetical protein